MNFFQAFVAKLCKFEEKRNDFNLRKIFRNIVTVIIIHAEPLSSCINNLAYFNYYKKNYVVIKFSSSIQAKFIK